MKLKPKSDQSQSFWKNSCLAIYLSHTMITLSSKWHQISSRGSAKRVSWTYPDSIPPRLAPRAAQVRLRKTLDLCITGSRLSHLQRRKLSIAVSSDILMSNLVHPDTLSPRVPKLDLDSSTLSRPDPPPPASNLGSSSTRSTPPYATSRQYLSGATTPEYLSRSAF